MMSGKKVQYVFLCQQTNKITCKPVMFPKLFFRFCFNNTGSTYSVYILQTSQVSEPWNLVVFRPSMKFRNFHLLKVSTFYSCKPFFITLTCILNVKIFCRAKVCMSVDTGSFYLAIIWCAIIKMLRGKYLYLLLIFYGDLNAYMHLNTLTFKILSTIILHSSHFVQCKYACYPCFSYV